MPARKPAGLIKRHETASEKAARVAGEAALAPKRALPARPPARLDGHKTAQAIWRQMMRMYGELEAEVVTRMDLDILLDYCMLMEQVEEMDEMRKAAYSVWAAAKAIWEKRMSEQVDADKLLEAMSRMQAALAEAVKLDGRVDQKRKLLLQLRQSLYMTPRARAGAAPEKKEAPEPLDAMEVLLGEVTNYVNRRPAE